MNSQAQFLKQRATRLQELTKIMQQDIGKLFSANLRRRMLLQRCLEFLEREDPALEFDPVLATRRAQLAQEVKTEVFPTLVDVPSPRLAPHPLAAVPDKADTSP